MKKGFFTEISLKVCGMETPLEVVLLNVKNEESTANSANNKVKL